MNKILTFLFFHSVIVISLFGGVRSTVYSYSKKSNTNAFIFHKPDTAYRIIVSSGNTCGYEILINGNIIIRQLNIPGESGTKGFKTKRDAEKVAQLVIKKLRLGIMPPSIEREELDKLKIAY